MKGKMLLLIMMSLIVATSCDDDDDDIDLDQLTEESFVQQAGINNLFEIRTSEVTVDDAETAEVRQFAEQMIADHTAATNELKALADAKGLTVPTSLPQDRQAIVQRLEGKEGVPLDQDYMDVQVQSHIESVALFEQAADELDDEELRNFAEQTLPLLEAHLEMAREIEEMTNELE
ncbi:DUF4142 domain-containing protein [Pontibacter korlensis]